MPEAAEASQLPHGLMGLQPQAFPWSTVILIGLGLLALGLIAWILWRQFRRKTASNVLVPPVIPQDPWLNLEQKLQTLDIQEPWTRESSEEFFFRLSFLLREALELRTGLPVTGQTLAETRQGLEKSPALSANFQQELLKFLSLSEQLKFAGQWLGASEARVWRETVKAWIEDLHRGVLS